jgi:thiamine-monophosphate kinase
VARWHGEAKLVIVAGTDKAFAGGHGECASSGKRASSSRAPTPLLADLGHICASSGVGARLELARLPLPDGALAVATRESLVGSGDDYELCFTVPPRHEPALGALAANVGCAVTRIGQIEAAPGLWLVDEAGQTRPAAQAGHDHFR